MVNILNPFDTFKVAHNQLPLCKISVKQNFFCEFKTFQSVLCINSIILHFNNHIRIKISTIQNQSNTVACGVVLITSKTVIFCAKQTHVECLLEQPFSRNVFQLGFLCVLVFLRRMLQESLNRQYDKLLNQERETKS